MADTIHRRRQRSSRPIARQPTGLVEGREGEGREGEELQAHSTLQQLPRYSTMDTHIEVCLKQVCMGGNFQPAQKIPNML